MSAWRAVLKGGSECASLSQAGLIADDFKAPTAAAPVAVASSEYVMSGFFLCASVIAFAGPVVRLPHTRHASRYTVMSPLAWCQRKYQLVAVSDAAPECEESSVVVMVSFMPDPYLCVLAQNNTHHGATGCHACCHGTEHNIFVRRRQGPEADQMGLNIGLAITSRGEMNLVTIVVGFARPRLAAKLRTAWVRVRRLHTTVTHVGCRQQFKMARHPFV